MRGVNFPRLGSWGLNTQQETMESDNDHRWASVASNGVIDTEGKLCSRKDFVLQTSGFSGTVESVYVHTNNDATQTVLSAAAGKIYSGTGTFTQRHDYSATSTTLNSWQFASLSSRIFGFQAGIAPFCLNESTFASVAFVGAPWTQSPNIIIAASGRLFAADDAAGSNRHTLWWSNLLDGTTWNAGDAGNLNVQRVWPGGQDSIVAVAIYQDRVIIFGRNNILLYTLPADRNPANMTLTDAITNIGCEARDSVVFANGDLYFLAKSGYYKITRLAQVTSLMALTKVSMLVADDFAETLEGETLHKVRAGFNPVENFLVLSMPTNNVTWCWHVDRMVLSSGENSTTIPAVTRWTNTSVPFRGFAFDKDGNWYAAQTNGLGKYTGYTPSVAGNAYTFEYMTLWTTLQDETRIKILQAWALTLKTDIGQTGTFQWRMDFKEGTTRSESFTAGSAEFAEAPGVGVVRGSMGGECNVAKFGISTTINGDKVTLQSARLYAKPGATKIR